MLFSQQRISSVQAGPKEEQEEDELEYWNEALRTLKLPSLCHGHSVKGPGLVAMASDAPCSCAGHHPGPKSPSPRAAEPNVLPQRNPGSAHPSPGALSCRFITARSEAKSRT